MTKWYIENDVLFLLKTLKKEYLESTLDGKLYFSCPETFTSTSNGLLSGQQDTYDSHLSYIAQYLVCAPIVSAEGEPIRYGKGIKIADTARIHELSNRSRNSPMCCFRKVTDADIEHREENDVFRLGNLVDQIKAEMGHNAYILIVYPDIFLHRLNAKERFFAHSVHYGEIDEKFEDFMETFPKQQCEIFQKREEYSWQKEYRLVLSTRKSADPVFVDMGSIRDIAISGDLEELRLGFAFWKAQEDDSFLCKNYRRKGQ